MNDDSLYRTTSIILLLCKCLHITFFGATRLLLSKQNNVRQTLKDFIWEFLCLYSFLLGRTFCILIEYRKSNCRNTNSTRACHFHPNSKSSHTTQWNKHIREGLVTQSNAYNRKSQFNGNAICPNGKLDHVSPPITLNSVSTLYEI